MNDLNLKSIGFAADDNNFKQNWERLSQQVLTNTLSMEFTWFKSCAEACNDFSLETNVLELKDNCTGKVVALIPYMIRNETLYHLFDVKAVYLMRFHQEYGDHYELLIAPEYYESTMDALASWIAKTKIDVCFIKNMHRESKLHSSFFTKGRFPFLPTIVEKVPCPFIWLPTQDKYKEWSAGKFKRAMQYKRRLERSFQVSYLRVKNQEELADILGIYKVMHTRRFENKGALSSLCSDPIPFRFLERIVYNAFENKILMCNYIKLNDQIASVEISFLIKNKLFAYTVAYDENYAQYRIGAVQTLNMIEKAVAQGADVLDLLQGDEGYKQLWTKTVALDHNLVLFPKNSYGHFLFLITLLRVPLSKLYQLGTCLKGILPKIPRVPRPRELKT